MKKQPRKKRKHQRGHARRSERPQARTVRVEEKKTDEPLTGMVIRKKNIYTPTEIDREWISFAFANQENGPKSELLFRPAAVRELQAYIDWGSATARNCVEQQGVLLGTVYRTPSGYAGVVEAVLLSEAEGNAVYVESAHAQWFEMDRQMEERNKGRDRKLVKVGWWHTHPNMNVFMSGTDRETQSNYFHKDWQFAAVLNPQAKKWAAFIGEDATPCMGCFLNRNPFRAVRSQKDGVKKKNKEGRK